MEFKPIIPQSAKETMVRISPGKRGATISIPATVAKKCGIEADGTVALFHGAKRNVHKVKVAGDVEGGFKARSRSQTVTIVAKELSPTDDGMKAAPVQYAIEDGSLIITLPDGWVPSHVPA